jgi:hypothetical protein
MVIILKANKVNLFVSSVLFVFWYHSPNFLDTPHTKKGVNGTEMHIKSSTGKKTVKNMEKCVHDRGFCEWLCIMITLRIKQ